MQYTLQQTVRENLTWRVCKEMKESSSVGDIFRLHARRSIPNTKQNIEE